MRNTRNFFKAMGFVLAAVLLFTINANAGDKGQKTQLILKTHKVTKFSQPRAPTLVRHIVPNREQIAGLGPQPEPPDLPLAVANPSQVAGISPQPEPPTLPVTSMNPSKLGDINPQPEPPRQRYFMSRYVQLQE